MILRRIRWPARWPVTLRGYLVTGSVAVVAVTFMALTLLLWAFFIRHFQVGRVSALLPRAADVAHLLERNAHAALLRVASLARAGGGDVWLIGRRGGVLRRYPRTRVLAALGQWVTPTQVRQVLAGHALAFVAPAHGWGTPMAVVGDPAHCARRFAALARAGVDRLLCAVGAGALPSALVRRSLPLIAAAAGLGPAPA